MIEQGRVTKILAFRGLERVPVGRALAGDIVAIAGFSKAIVADTLCDMSVETPLLPVLSTRQTIAMTFRWKRPRLWREPKAMVKTSRVIRDRLMREIEGNVAIQR